MFFKPFFFSFFSFTRPFVPTYRYLVRLTLTSQGGSMGWMSRGWGTPVFDGSGSSQRASALAKEGMGGGVCGKEPRGARKAGTAGRWGLKGACENRTADTHMYRNRLLGTRSEAFGFPNGERLRCALMAYAATAGALDLCFVGTNLSLLRSLHGC